jgi:hypothetical protein
MDILSFKKPFTNSHILNTLLMKWSGSVFGHSELALRLPNVLSILPYMYFGFLLLQELKNKWLVIPGFIMLVANPFLLDFFSLARGYALAISFIISSVYFYSRYIKTQRNLFYLLALITGGISVLANFISLYYLAMLVGMHFIFTLINFWSDENKNKSWLNYFYKKNKMGLYFFPVYGLIMFEPLRRLSALPLDFGGTQGLWQDTAMSLIYKIAYEFQWSGFVPVLQVLIYITLPGIFIFWILVFIHRKKEKFSSVFLPIFIQAAFIGILCLSYLLHITRGTQYLTDRMALFLAPIFWLSFIFLADQVKWKIWAIPTYVISIILGIQTCFCFSSDYYFFWETDASNQQMLARLQTEQKTNQPDQIQLGISWYLEPSLNYYRTTLHLTWLKPLTRDRLQPGDHYCYILWEDSNWVTNHQKYQLLETYPLSKTSLYKVTGP